MNLSITTVDAFWDELEKIGRARQEMELAKVGAFYSKPIAAAGEALKKLPFRLRSPITEAPKEILRGAARKSIKQAPAGAGHRFVTPEDMQRLLKIQAGKRPPHIQQRYAAVDRNTQQIQDMLAARNAAPAMG